MSTDSAGGHYARALAAGMEPGQLERAFFSETSGMINLGIGRLAVGMLYTENIRNKKDNEAISPDTEKMDAAKVARFARAFNAYADTPQHIELDAKRVRMAQQVGSLWTSLCALAQGPDGRNNPVAADLNALLERQPDAAVAFGMAEADPLYESLAKSHFAAQRLLRAITVQHAEVKVIMIPGMSHAYNTHFPSFYHAVKRYALGL
ncbi:MAG TPA: hypothetical protein VFT53_03970 [Candidatus Saccharimonadales bacterium]|nr:hypothetical protein [Candidatus Saccharimonadales bacterium]